MEETCTIAAVAPLFVIAAGASVRVVSADEPLPSAPRSVRTSV